MLFTFEAALPPTVAAVSVVSQIILNDAGIMILISLVAVIGPFDG